MAKNSGNYPKSCKLNPLVCSTEVSCHTAIQILETLKHLIIAKVTGCNDLIAAIISILTTINAFCRSVTQVIYALAYVQLILQAAAAACI